MIPLDEEDDQQNKTSTTRDVDGMLLLMKTRVRTRTTLVARYQQDLLPPSPALRRPAGCERTLAAFQEERGALGGPSNSYACVPLITNLDH